MLLPRQAREMARHKDALGFYFQASIWGIRPHRDTKSASGARLQDSPRSHVRAALTSVRDDGSGTLKGRPLGDPRERQPTTQLIS
jgi:hypothetical protein